MRIFLPNVPRALLLSNPKIVYAFGELAFNKLHMGNYCRACTVRRATTYRVVDVNVVQPDCLLLFAIRDKTFETIEGGKTFAQDIHDAHSERVAGRSRQRLVEANVVFLPGVVGDIEVAHGIEPRLHRGEIGLGADPRGLTRAPAFQGATDLEELADPMRLDFYQIQQWLIDRQLGLAGYDEATSAVPHFNKSDKFRPIDRLANRLPAGVEHGCELARGRQPAAAGKLPGTDELGNLLKDLVRLTPAFEREK